MSESAYVAVGPRLWGDRTIPDGEPVPDGEPGRDYAGMIQRGEIRRRDGGRSSAVDAERLARLEERIARLEAAQAAPQAQQQRGNR